jgi:hypothetical protein
MTYLRHWSAAATPTKSHKHCVVRHSYARTRTLQTLNIYCLKANSELQLQFENQSHVRISVYL